MPGFGIWFITHNWQRVHNHNLRIWFIIYISCGQRILSTLLAIGLLSRLVGHPYYNLNHCVTAQLLMILSFISVIVAERIFVSNPKFSNQFSVCRADECGRVIATHNRNFVRSAASPVPVRVTDGR